jgi:excisionase family DNA binding protein
MAPTRHPGNEDLSLPEAAARLGVHYMTAYRYVRTGRLSARQVGGEWRVKVRDLEAMRNPAPRRAGRPLGPAATRNRLIDRLVAGDEVGAWALIESAVVAGLDPVAAHLELLAPAMATVGDRWAEGTVSIDEEHQAAAVANRLIGRLGPRFVRAGRKLGTVVLAGAPDDHHSLPVSLAADVVRAAGYAVVDLGAAVPPAELARAIADVDRLVAVGICTSLTDNEAAVVAAVAAARAARPEALVLVGGVASDDALAAAAGADGHGADAAALVALLEAHQRT